MKLELKVSSLKARFTVEIGQPVSLFSPNHLGPDACRRICKLIQRQQKNHKVSTIDGQRFVSTSNPLNHRRTRSFLNDKKMQLELPFVLAKLGYGMNGKVCGFSRSDRVLLEMALVARPNAVILFSTSGSDPSGAQMLLEYATLLSQYCYMIHLDNPNTQPPEIPEVWVRAAFYELGSDQE